MSILLLFSPLIFTVIGISVISYKIAKGQK